MCKGVGYGHPRSAGLGGASAPCVLPEKEHASCLMRLSEAQGDTILGVCRDVAGDGVRFAPGEAGAGQHRGCFPAPDSPVAGLRTGRRSTFVMDRSGKQVAIECRAPVPPASPAVKRGLWEGTGNQYSHCKKSRNAVLIKAVRFCRPGSPRREARPAT